MPHDPAKARRPALRDKLVEESRRLDVMIDGRSDQEAGQAVSKAWLEENREAIEASNRWVRENGLPLAKYRQF